jgi:mRNA interferase RelE/StbE
MSYQVIIPKPLQKQIDKIPQETRDRVLEKILELVENPRPSGTKKLKGSDSEYRIRVGDYRVRYEIDDRGFIILLSSCRHRKDVYRD